MRPSVAPPRSTTCLIRGAIKMFVGSIEEGRMAYLLRIGLLAAGLLVAACDGVMSVGPPPGGGGSENSASDY